MRILVTGLGGFVGRHLSRHLVESGDHVCGLHLGPCAEIPGVQLEHGDVLDRDFLDRLIGECRPDVIVHLAGLSHVGSSWERMADYFRVNVLGTENVLRSADGRRVVLASSAEVYGQVPREEQPIAEDRRLDPRTPYALTKAAAERLTIMHGGVIMRSFNQVGPGQTSGFALPSFSRQLAAIRHGTGASCLRVGNLAAERDFVHVADGAAAIRLLAEHGEAGEAYNIASGESHSIGEVLTRLIEISGVDARQEEDPEKLRPVDMPLLRGDASKLRALGWRPERGLERALRELWDEALEIVAQVGNELQRDESCLAGGSPGA